jgi:Arc/MetJ-type ribon-helix-helix transcriptional regulator
MNVPLSDRWQTFVRDEVVSGRFASESAVLEEALGLLRLREQARGRVICTGYRSIRVMFEDDTIGAQDRAHEGTDGRDALILRFTDRLT